MLTLKRIERSVVLLFFVIVWAFLIDFVFFNDSVHVVINREVFQFGCIYAFVEDQLKLIVQCVRQRMLFAVWTWWRREDRVNSDSKFKTRKLMIFKLELTLRHFQSLRGLSAQGREMKARGMGWCLLQLARGSSLRRPWNRTRTLRKWMLYVLDPLFCLQLSSSVEPCLTF